ncbi:c-type cytochrome [Pseudidiomarina taiwanensis]|uniref:Cytochrome c4 n=1 Tax=Pseudidiomarina taiwanensis TaxID=337250 RepID=A0A432ZEJ6_9GAMM|nr:c-type cytochrome [Pseudidiomarina taiwanensis]RUO76386.1 cytochrome c4 [Pseudidiomarina taiwanensis]
MKNIALSVGVLVAGLFAASSAAYAAEGDAEAGQSKAMVCAACHGPNGNSASGMYPSLAGQHASYLAKQLTEYRLAAQTNGEQGRANAIMQGQAMNLSDQDIADLAAYFSEQTAEIVGAPEDVVAAGAKLYLGGDEERGLTACVACHGPRGDGMGLAGFPDISGNHPEYIKAQLEMFRSGQRNNDLNGMMRDIAKKMTDEDIEILSQYLAGLY